jgi:hypothetical protein
MGSNVRSLPVFASRRLIGVRSWLSSEAKLMASFSDRFLGEPSLELNDPTFPWNSDFLWLESFGLPT